MEKADTVADLAAFFARLLETEDDQIGTAHVAHAISLSALALIETIERVSASGQNVRMIDRMAMQRSDA
jgi:hypothetical protein